MRVTSPVGDVRLGHGPAVQDVCRQIANDAVASLVRNVHEVRVPAPCASTQSAMSSKNRHDVVGDAEGRDRQVFAGQLAAPDYPRTQHDVDEAVQRRTEGAAGATNRLLFVRTPTLEATAPPLQGWTRSISRANAM